MTAQLFHFDSSKILTIGSTCIDTYWHGNVERISPEAPVPVTHYKKTEHRLAGAGLIAAILQRLSTSRDFSSQETKLVSITAKENIDLDRILKELLDNANIDISENHLLGIANQVAQQIRVVSRAQQLLGINKTKQCIHDLDDLVRLNDVVMEQIAQCKVIVLYDDGSNLLNNKYLSTWLRYCNQHEIKIIYCAKDARISKDFIKQNCSDDTVKIDYLVLTNVCQQDLPNTGTNILILDEQQQCLQYFSPENKSITCKEPLLEVENNIGILEGVVAVLALGVTSELVLENILRMSTAAISKVSRSFGQVIFNIVDLQLAYADNLLNGKYTYFKLYQEIQACREKGQKIVFANGCFDVMHIGHFTYLAAAKQRGDKLFVAINSDDSIKRLKGESRPVNPLIDRVSLLSQLEYVDWVVPFFTDTPRDLLDWLKPDVLVKGGDYDISGVVGKEIVEAYGGRVEVINHAHTEMSSTKIIEKNTNHV